MGEELHILPVDPERLQRLNRHNTNEGPGWRRFVSRAEPKLFIPILNHESGEMEGSESDSITSGDRLSSLGDANRTVDPVAEAIL
ncbi:MAG: hypothetical protein WC985_09535, partial [Thermoplasmata archaeon]